MNNWIEWHGEDNPVGEKLVEIKYGSGVTAIVQGNHVCWSYGLCEDDEFNIIAYRIVE